MIVTLYVDDGLALEFDGVESVKYFFGLDEVSEDDLKAADGKHVCVDPYSEDIHGSRVLMWADTAHDLGEAYSEACADI